MPQFFQPINLNNLELLNARLQNLATEPAASEGKIFFNTATGRVGVAVGGSWVYLTDSTDTVQIDDLDDVADSLTRIAMTPAERTKLASVLADATKNQTDAFLLARANHTGTQSADTITNGTNNKVFTTAEQTKLSGVASGATANSTDAALRARSSHTGTQSADTVVDGTTNKVFTATEQTKLAGIAAGATVNTTADSLTDGTTNKLMTATERTKLAAIAEGATANSTDAALRARASHTGTQSADTITDGTTNKVLTAANATKLAGIATGATANATDAQLRDRSTHTGTQTASTISDFDTQVRTSRLDQMAAPTAAVSANNQRITGVGTPTAATDAATKGYVDSAVQGLDTVPSVRAATTTNITLSGLQTIDGISLAVGNRVLVKNQTTASANGIYVVASGAWTRPADATTGSMTSNLFVFVEEGATQADTGWTLTNDGAITVGTTALTFAQFSGAGSVEAGNGLTRSGNTLSVGAGTGIVVDSTSVRVDTNVVARKFSQTLTTASTSYTVTHNLNTQDVQISVRAVSTGEIVYPDMFVGTVNTATITFAVAPAANAYRVTVVG